MGKRIGIVSGKGGTGKTTVAINLAAAIQSLGEHSLLVDANLEHPHVAEAIGLAVQDSLHDVLLGEIPPAHAIHLHESGLKVVPGAIFPKPIKDLDPLKRFGKAADVVLFDAPPANHQHVLDAVDQVLLVINGDRLAIRDAQKTIAQAQAQKKIIIGAVVNGTTDKRALTAIANQIGTQAFGIPYDERFYKSLQQQVPYYFTYDKTPAGKAYTELAARICGRPF